MQKRREGAEKPSRGVATGWRPVANASWRPSNPHLTCFRRRKSGRTPPRCPDWSRGRCRTAFRTGKSRLPCTSRLGSVDPDLGLDPDLAPRRRNRRTPRLRRDTPAPALARAYRRRTGRRSSQTSPQSDRGTESPRAEPPRPPRSRRSGKPKRPSDRSRCPRNRRGFRGPDTRPRKAAASARRRQLARQDYPTAPRRRWKAHRRHSADYRPRCPAGRRRRSGVPSRWSWGRRRLPWCCRCSRPPPSQTLQKLLHKAVDRPRRASSSVAFARARKRPPKTRGIASSRKPGRNRARFRPAYVVLRSSRTPTPSW